MSGSEKPPGLPFEDGADDIFLFGRAFSKPSADADLEAAGGAEPADLKAAYRPGADSYTVKPAGSESLFNAAEKILTYWLVLNRKPGKEHA